MDGGSAVTFFGYAQMGLVDPRDTWPLYKVQKYSDRSARQVLFVAHG